MKKSELRKLIQEAMAAQPRVAGDVTSLEKAIDSSPVNKSLLRINNATEFMQAFGEWVKGLGITSTNSGDKTKTPVTKGTVVSAINKVLTDLNWK
jgi:hypothetical protein